LEQQEKKAKKGSKKLIFNLLYIGLTIGIILGYGLLNPELNGVLNVIGDLSPIWMLIAIGVLLIHWGSSTMSLRMFVKGVGENISFRHAIKVTMIGCYYSAITPFASGGQPIQVMYLKRDGIPVGKSSCVFSLKFIVFQLTMCLYFIVGMILRGGYYYAAHPEIFWLTVLGIVINATMMALVIFVIISKVKTLMFATKVINFLAKIKLVKRPEQTLLSVTKTLDEYHASSKYIGTNLVMMIKGLMYSTLEMGAYFFITYCIYRALGLQGSGVIDIVFLQAFLYLTVSFVPLPGAALASEGGFFIFFNVLFPGAQLIYVAMLIWRLFTYYSNLLVGAGFVLTDSLMSVFKKKKVPVESDTPS